MRNKRGNKQEAQPAKFVLKNNNSNNKRDKGIRNSTRTVGKQRQEEVGEEEGERVAIYLNLPFNLSRCWIWTSPPERALSSARLCCNKNQLIIYHLNSPPLVIMSLFTHCPQREGERQHKGWHKNFLCFSTLSIVNWDGLRVCLHLRSWRSISWPHWCCCA